MSKSVVPMNDCRKCWHSNGEELEENTANEFSLDLPESAFLSWLYIWGKEVEQHCDVRKPRAEQGIKNDFWAHIQILDKQQASSFTILFLGKNAFILRKQSEW